MQPPAAAITGAPQLRSATLSQAESLGQSIANIAPTLTPALNISVVATLAGSGTWIAYLVATIGMLFVGANIGALARRHPQAGSYFLYIGRNLGPMAGAMGGVAMVGAYLMTAVAVTLSFAIFFRSVLDTLGLGAAAPPTPVLIGGFILMVWLAGYRDIQLSSRLALVLEGLSVGIIVLITAVVIARHGTLFDPTQFDPARITAGGVMSALPFAVFSFVGFESAATLAKETRDAHTAIPRAIMVSAGAVGLFFVVIAYLMVLGMDGDAAAIGATSAPFSDLTAKLGLGWLAAVVYFSAMISGFACALASINAGARLLYSMGRYQFVPARLGRVHDRHQTPHLAVTACCLLTLVLAVALLPMGILEAFGLAGTFGTLGFLVIYLMTCVVAPMDLRRTGSLRAGQAMMAAAGIALMGFVLAGSVWPIPPWPLNLVPYLFAAYMAAGAAWFLALRRLRPLDGLVEDLET